MSDLQECNMLHPPQPTTTKAKYNVKTPIKSPATTHQITKNQTQTQPKTTTNQKTKPALSLSYIIYYVLSLHECLWLLDFLGGGRIEIVKNAIDLIQSSVFLLYRER